MTTVEVRRDEAGWWVATSRDVPGMVTQARRLDQIADRAREAIAVLDGPVDDIKLVVRIPEHDDAVRRYLRGAHPRGEVAG